MSQRLFFFLFFADYYFLYYTNKKLQYSTNANIRSLDTSPFFTCWDIEAQLVHILLGVHLCCLTSCLNFFCDVCVCVCVCVCVLEVCQCLGQQHVHGIEHYVT